MPKSRKRPTARKVAYMPFREAPPAPTLIVDLAAYAEGILIQLTARNAVLAAHPTASREALDLGPLTPAGMPSGMAAAIYEWMCRSVNDATVMRDMEELTGWGAEAITWCLAGHAVEAEPDGR